MGNDYKRRIDELSAQAQDQGWTVTFTAAGQVRFVPPAADQPSVYASARSSDPTVADNLLVLLRRSGLRDN